MTQDMVVGLARQAVELTLILSLPMLLLGLVVGVVVGLFQAVTQIQEMTLSFVPKIIAILLGLLVSFPWLMNRLVDFTTDLIERIPVMVR